MANCTLFSFIPQLSVEGNSVLKFVSNLVYLFMSYCAVLPFYSSK